MSESLSQRCFGEFPCVYRITVSRLQLYMKEVSFTVDKQFPIWPEKPMRKANISPSKRHFQMDNGINIAGEKPFRQSMCTISN